MLFVIDVGNTHTVLGVFNGPQLVEHWRIQTHDGRTADEHGSLIRQLFDFAEIAPSDIDGAIMSCVVPPMESALAQMADQYFDLQLLVVGRDVAPPMEVHLPNPDEVGADRLVNSFAAWGQEPTAQVVVDFGTATTFDAISGEGHYVGGAIAPGIIVSSEALFETASKLPRVELARPDSVIGTTTVDSMQSGLTYGYIGLVREIVGRMQRELGRESRVVATGGLAGLLADESDIVDRIDKQLTIKGLRQLYEQR